MKRDVLLGAIGIIASALVAWSFTGSPPYHGAPPQLTADLALKVASEQSPYMRIGR